MNKFTYIVAVLINFLFTTQMCRSKEEVSSVRIKPSCFTKESLKNVPWQKDKLAYFQRRYEEGLNVSVRYYNNEYFLTVENMYCSSFNSSDMLTIFDCSGNANHIIGAEDNVFFYDHSKEVTVLLKDGIAVKQ